MLQFGVNTTLQAERAQDHVTLGAPTVGCTVASLAVGTHWGHDDAVEDGEVVAERRRVFHLDRSATSRQRTLGSRAQAPEARRVEAWRELWHSVSCRGERCAAPWTYISLAAGRHDGR